MLEDSRPILAVCSIQQLYKLQLYIVYNRLNTMILN